MIATGMDRRRVAGAEAVLAEEEDVGTSESETSTVATHRRLSGHLRSAGGATAVRMDPPCRRSTIGAAPRPPAAGATTTPADPRSARGAIRPRPIARRGRGGGGGGRTARPGPGTGATPRDRRRRATVAGGGATPARRRGATPARRPQIPQQSGSAEAGVAEAVAGAAGAGGGAGAPPRVPRGPRRRPYSTTRPPRTSARYSSRSSSCGPTSATSRGTSGARSVYPRCATSSSSAIGAPVVTRGARTSKWVGSRTSTARWGPRGRLRTFSVSRFW